MSAASRLVQCRRRIRALMDSLEQYREHWINKQIHVEQVELRAEAAERSRDRLWDALLKRLENTRCGCGMAWCERCQDDDNVAAVLEDECFRKGEA